MTALYDSMQSSNGGVSTSGNKSKPSYSVMKSRHFRTTTDLVTYGVRFGANKSVLPLVGR